MGDEGGRILLGEMGSRTITNCGWAKRVDLQSNSDTRVLPTTHVGDRRTLRCWTIYAKRTRPWQMSSMIALKLNWNS